MNILIVLLRYSGGVGKANTKIAECLRKKGHKVTILAREDDLECYRTNLETLSYMRYVIRKLVRRDNIDIIYTQDYSCALPLLFPNRIFKDKHFCCFCGDKNWTHPTLVQWHHKVVQRIIGRIMGKRLVAIGDTIKEHYPKATRIYRGVDFKEFKPLGLKRDCIGWIKRDYEDFSEEQLKLVGKALGLKPIIAEGIPPEKMNEFYNKCLAFISFPRVAGYNNCWNEAMAADVPYVFGNYKGGGLMLPLFHKAIYYTHHAKIELPNKLVLKDETFEIYKVIKEKQISPELNNRKYNGKNRRWLMDNKFSWEDKTQELLDYWEAKR